MVPLEAERLAAPLGPRYLTKSEFIAGTQCHKRLWWMVNEPMAQELVPDRHAKALMAMGRVVGQTAREYVQGGLGVTIGPAYQGTAERTEATRFAIETGAPAIYEATFAAEGCAASVDILERVDGGWALVEVKASSSVKDEYVVDAAFQAMVARASGVPVVRIEIMHLDSGCRHPDLSRLYSREDVTARAAELAPALAMAAQAQRAMLEGPLPEIEIGPSCEKPDCPFQRRCWPVWPPHHVSTLYNAGKSWWEWRKQGWHTIHDLPADLKFRGGAATKRQLQAVSAGAIVVEDGLGAALAGWRRPLAFLDFETVQLAIPVWPGCGPFMQVPVQFSCHIEDGAAPNGLRHYDYLAEGSADCRRELAIRLVDACAGAGTIVTYNASFERRGIMHLAEAVPELADSLHAINERIVDLLPVVRDHVYHPGFGGSFSLKKVLPALVPSVTYDELEICEGMTAKGELEQLLFHGAYLSAQEHAITREHLMEYCKLDTEAMVMLFRRLVELGRSHP